MEPLLEDQFSRLPTLPNIVVSPPTKNNLNIATTFHGNLLKKLDSDNKYVCSVSADRIHQLKKTVENAIREKKTFTIKGGWQTLRNALIKRHWIEKYESTKKKESFNLNTDDICNNLPSRQIWETAASHVEKCERIIMSRLLQMHEVDFYWNIRKDQTDWQHRVAHNKIISRFARSLFTSKEGLCLLLQQMYWFNEPGVAQVNFPRCYVLGFPDHFNNFVEDFRLTACVSLLKWFTEKYTAEDEYSLQSPEGTIPFSCLDFACKRCEDFIAHQKHADIDLNIAKIWDHDWDDFLVQYRSIVHDEALFLEIKESSIESRHKAASEILHKICVYLPQQHLDGVKNIWIMKPGNKCRGRGIQLIKTIDDVAKVVNMKLKFVVQKYIERPLIIYETKFDIRQWFMITSVQPLVIWLYRESYLRFSSQIFSLENFHESLHLTNHAVQCKYTNVNKRDKALPEENMWDCHTFKTYLKQIGHMHKWTDVIYPGMQESIIGAMLACQETMDRRPNTFEIYGADFMLDEEFNPWLLEINSCPDLSPSTSVTARMCPQCLEDVIKVIIDKRKDIKADTGLFECVYKQSLPRAPAYLGMSLSVRGRKIFKNRTKYTKSKEEESKKKYIKDPPISRDFAILDDYPPSAHSSYTGPEIGDLMEELHNSYYHNSENGVDFIPAVKLPKKKSLSRDRKPKKKRKY